MDRVKSAVLRFRRGNFWIGLLVCGAIGYVILHYLLGFDADLGKGNFTLSVDASVIGSMLLDRMFRMEERDAAWQARIEQAEERIASAEERIESRLS